MTVMPLPYVEAPPTAPSPYGLLDAATVIDTSDPRDGFGYEYQPDFCGVARTTVAACLPAAAPIGTFGGSVTSARVLTINGTGVPAGTYTIDWGDGSNRSTATAATNSFTANHTYAVNGNYPVRVTGPDGWIGTGTALVTTGATSSLTGTVTAGKGSDPSPPVVQGDPFVVYSLFSCKTVGVYDASARAARSLELGESRAVEDWLAGVLKAEATDLALSLTTNPLVSALAALEGYAHCTYGGVPMIHMTRAAAIGLYALRALERDGDRLVTGLGSTVSAGCYVDAYTGTGQHPLREQWMWATGTVMFRRGPVFTPPDPVIDQATNEQFALAERTYSGSYECFAVGQKVAQT